VCLDRVQHWRGEAAERRRAFLNHVDVALGSQGEVEVQLEIARPTTNYQLPTTNYQLPTTNYQLPPHLHCWLTIAAVATASLAGASRSSTNVFHS
jgi:hypothetical protein